MLSILKQCFQFDPTLLFCLSLLSPYNADLVMNFFTAYYEEPDLKVGPQARRIYTSFDVIIYGWFGVLFNFLLHILGFFGVKGPANRSIGL